MQDDQHITAAAIALGAAVRAFQADHVTTQNPLQAGTSADAALALYMTVTQPPGSTNSEEAVAAIADARDMFNRVLAAALVWMDGTCCIAREYGKLYRDRTTRGAAVLKTQTVRAITEFHATTAKLGMSKNESVAELQRRHQPCRDCTKPWE